MAAKSSGSAASFHRSPSGGPGRRRAPRSDARVLGVFRVDQAGKQRRRFPGGAQRLLQVDQRQPEHLFLHGGAAQRPVGLLPVADVDRQRRRKTPQQDFGEIVQQGGDGDFLDVQILPPQRPFVRVVGGALYAANDLQGAEHRLRLAFSACARWSADP